MIDQPSSHITRELLAPILVEQHENFLGKDLGLERELLYELAPIIQAPQITVITGLRRVGKSTLLAQIAQRYLKDAWYFVNFDDERLLQFQVEDFDVLHEVLITQFGEKSTFLFDEIQNVPEWERFVRRLHDQGCKVIVTGSNASLLSRELGTRLTGRSIRVEVFPFSFREFARFRAFKLPTSNVLITRQRGQLHKLLGEYVASGGIPDALKYPELQIHKTLYDDVLYRDIATRYQIENVKSLKELSLYLMSNISSLTSFNKLKALLRLGSVSTVSSYVDHLESSWLFFVMNKYAYSVKEQQIAAKKIYSIDTGLAQSVGFSFSENMGKLLENVVFLHLRRQGLAAYYYKTAQEYEVDFFLPKEQLFIQVAHDLDHPETRDREVRALLAAAREQKGTHQLVVVTESEKATFKEDGLEISVLPLYEWLLKS